jgi:UTP:GlnB (protein PII) uridylyltransferase
VLELAAHIGEATRCDSLYLLAAATEGDPTSRDRLDELHGLVTAVLEHPELTGEAASDIIEIRKQEVARLLPRAAGLGVQRLLDDAPRRYILAHPPEDIARHLMLLDPPPSRNEVRIRPEPHLSVGEWTVHVAAVDRPGALAALAGAFAEHDVPILEASISTWPNGIAADVFRVAAPANVDWEAVRDTAAQALARHGKDGKPVPIEGTIEIDNAASPWHTIVEVRAEDRAGLLHRVAEAFSRAGVRIHHATVRTVDGLAVDTFVVTGRTGYKLGTGEQRDLRLSLAGKLKGKWRPGRLLRHSSVVAALT